MPYPQDTHGKVQYPNELLTTLRQGEPIDDTLHVITVISNPCGFRRRIQLAKEFMIRMEKEPNIRFYVVELSYSGRFELTNPRNPRHLRLRADVPLWHKENMVNIGVRHLLPEDWKCFAWIDADIEFENPTWALDALKILNNGKDVVQLWSHCDDMDKNQHTMKVFQSFAYQYCKRRDYRQDQNFWHPGYAWAMTREAYDRIGGLYELSILGSGDHNMAMALLGYESLNAQTSRGYKKSLEIFRHKCSLRLGYVPGVIRHHFHGSKKNRRYHDRWKILVEHQYDPFVHITRTPIGLLVPTEKCPKKLLRDIFMYFHERNEDE